MTVQEALKETQGRSAGAVNRSAVSYAETLIQPEETIAAAVIANIRTRREHFPGVVVLTDLRVLAVCGLPGIRRAVSLQLDELERCDETGSFLNYKATFSAKADGFSMTVNPEIGERFSRCLAVLNGETEEFDSVNEAGKSGILNPLLVRNFLRKRRAAEKEKARRRTRREAMDVRFAAGLEAESEVSREPEEDVKAAAQRLSRQLAQAREQGVIADTNPLAVAARLAKELAIESDDRQK